MVFKTTSTSKARSQGFTLAELLVAMPIGLLALAAACLLWAFASRSCASFLNYIELSAASKNALDRMSQEIRNARSLTSCASNQLAFVAGDGNQNSYSYNAGAQTLTQVRAGATNTLLKGCKYFEFKVYQRVPVFGTNTLHETWSTNTARVVQMKWTCTRQLTGSKDTAENMVSSRVVMRNH